MTSPPARRIAGPRPARSRARLLATVERHSSTLSSRLQRRVEVAVVGVIVGVLRLLSVVSRPSAWHHGTTEATCRATGEGSRGCFLWDVSSGKRRRAPGPVPHRRRRHGSFTDAAPSTTAVAPHATRPTELRMHAIGSTFAARVDRVGERRVTLRVRTASRSEHIRSLEAVAGAALASSKSPSGKPTSGAHHSACSSCAALASPAGTDPPHGHVPTVPAEVPVMGPPCRSPLETVGRVHRDRTRRLAFTPRSPWQQYEK